MRRAFDRFESTGGGWWSMLLMLLIGMAGTVLCVQAMAPLQKVDEEKALAFALGHRLGEVGLCQAQLVPIQRDSSGQEDELGRRFKSSGLQFVGHFEIVEPVTTGRDVKRFADLWRNDAQTQFLVFSFSETKGQRNDESIGVESWLDDGSSIETIFAEHSRSAPDWQDLEFVSPEADFKNINDLLARHSQRVSEVSPSVVNDEDLPDRMQFYMNRNRSWIIDSGFSFEWFQDVLPADVIAGARENLGSDELDTRTFAAMMYLGYREGLAEKTDAWVRHHFKGDASVTENSLVIHNLTTKAHVLTQFGVDGDDSQALAEVTSLPEDVVTYPSLYIVCDDLLQGKDAQPIAGQELVQQLLDSNTIKLVAEMESPLAARVYRIQNESLTE